MGVSETVSALAMGSMVGDVDRVVASEEDEEEVDGVVSKMAPRNKSAGGGETLTSPTTGLSIASSPASSTCGATSVVAMLSERGLQSMHKSGSVSGNQ